MHSKLKKLALITMPCVVSLALSACGGSSHHSSSSPSAEVLDWAQTTGTYDDASIVAPDAMASTFAFFLILKAISSC